MKMKRHINETAVNGTNSEAKVEHTHKTPKKAKHSDEDEIREAPDMAKSKTDFKEYYGVLRNQQNMLEDYVRTTAYNNGILQNPTDFKDKVVLDVGAGTGILSIFAAQCGAKKVYACEGSDMTKYAQRLIDGNGLSDVIEIVKGRVEEVELPEKVDAIISEPLGVLLLHERMCESFIVARDRFLKPGGKMFPHNGTIKLCPFADPILYSEQTQKLAFWNSRSYFGVDVTHVQEDACLEHFDQPVVGGFNPSQLLGNEEEYEVSFRNDSKESLYDITIPFRCIIQRTELMHGLACWFDVSLGGSDTEVILSTGPHTPLTHWQQCRLLLREPLAVNAHQTVVGELRMRVNDSLSYDLELKVELEGTSISRTMKYKLQNQYYRFDNTLAIPQVPHVAQLQTQAHTQAHGNGST